MNGKEDGDETDMKTMMKRRWRRWLNGDEDDDETEMKTMMKRRRRWWWNGDEDEDDDETETMNGDDNYRRWKRQWSEMKTTMNSERKRHDEWRCNGVKTEMNGDETETVNGDGDWDETEMKTTMNRDEDFEKEPACRWCTQRCSQLELDGGNNNRYFKEVLPKDYKIFMILGDDNWQDIPDFNRIHSCVF